ncbi:MAG TPA: FixH family protein [Pyrinomonadaceae bacterium]|nr:FixH family protein [Pyrinomonadaceae bacterium]
MKKIAIFLTVVAAAALFVACGSARQETAPGKVIKSTSAGNGLTVSLATLDGVLKHGNSEFTITFADASGNPVNVGAVGLTFHMPQMGTMAEMNNAATFTTTSTPGIYDGKAQIEVAGEWLVKITYEGSQGRGQASFPVTAQ